MIVFLSPSKTFTKTKTKGNTTPLFLSKQNQLLTSLKKLSFDDIKQKFKISDKLAQEVCSYYQDENESYCAVHLFGGISYSALNPKDLAIDNNLYVLDALYGLIRPFDNIMKYRLDFTIPWDTSLIQYWKHDITNYLIKTHKNDILIDLSSKEFMHLLPAHLTVIRIEFLENNKKPTNTLLKKLRGLMARYIIEHNILSIEELKEINIEQFQFNPSQSNNQVFVFEK